MTTPTPQATVNFVGFLVCDKAPGDRKPTFEGRLTLPDANEVELTCALWAHEYTTNPKTGEVQIMFYGRTDSVSPERASSPNPVTFNGAPPHHTQIDL